MILKPITDLRKRNPDQTMHVIGRGPSLRGIRAGQIGDGPVVAISYAIQVIEPLALPDVFSLQKDYWYTATTRPILAHAQESLQNSCYQFAAHPGIVYGFDNPVDFRIDVQTPSLVTCIYLARYMGCAGVRAYCCDAMTNGATQAVQDGQVVEVMRPDDYRIIGEWAERAAREINMPFEWVTI